MTKLVTVHGGHNNNAVGATGLGLHEENLTNDLAYRVAQLLSGCTFIPQDNGDVNRNLEYLVAEMNRLNNGSVAENVNLSIHFNSFSDPKAKGTECYYAQGYASDSIDAKIANALSSNVAYSIPTVDRGSKNNSSLYVIRNTKAVTSLLEVAFITNSSDMKGYDVDKVAHAIASCYSNYKGAPVNKPTTPPITVPENKPSTGWVKSYDERGVMTATERNWVKDYPSKSAPIIEYQQVGQEIYYNKVLWNDGLVWLQLRGWDGVTRYVAYADATSDNRMGRKYGTCR